MPHLLPLLPTAVTGGHPWRTAAYIFADYLIFWFDDYAKNSYIINKQAETRTVLLSCKLS